MAVMYEPIGELWLGKVPWDSSYRHVWHQGMIDKSLIISQFCTLHLTGFSWVPKSNVIKVPDNANSYIGYNYCVYKNNGKLFCAFVTEVEYLANQTTGLHLLEDVWHTWGENLVVKRCMVARQHVLSDNLGQWRASEPAMTLEPYILANHMFETTYDIVVVGTNAIPHLKASASGTIFQAHSESDFDGSDAVSGGLYGGLYSGAKYYGFLNSPTTLNNFLDNLNKCGAAESVCCMFMTSSVFVHVNADHTVSLKDANYSNASFSAPQNHGGGYVPRNKKCLTFPYAYAQMTDYNGGTMDVRYEDCNTWGEVAYQLRAGLDPACTVFLMLRNHMGQTLHLQSAMVVSQYPQCAWVFSAYQNWLAQNASTQNVKATNNTLQALGGIAMTGIGAALFATGAGAPAGGALAATGLTTAQVAAGGMMLSGAGSAVGAGLAEGARQAQIQDQSKQPNKLSGSASGNSLQSIGLGQGGYVCVGLQEQSARRLDQFFDVFGYQIDMVRVPDLTGRPSWNYVKTVGAQMGGAIPADRLAAMNRSFDNGITFWHNADVGNYGLNNDLA